MANHKNSGKHVGFSNRGIEWFNFCDEVLHHIENYTVPQYGDMPDDQISEWSAQEVMRSIGKRAARHGKNQRENQDELDLLKIAHEACIAYYKIKESKYER